MHLFGEVERILDALLESLYKGGTSQRRVFAISSQHYAFVVRKEAKKHGMQRRIEGADVEGKKVLVVEDTTTTGNSPLTAVAALREAGAEVVGVATVVDRETGAGDVIAAEGLEYRSLLGLGDLDLA